MTYIKGIILIIITGFGQIFAQNNDFYSLKDVQKFRFDRLEINNDKEAQTLIKSSGSYNFIEAIKIHNISLLKEVLDAIGNFTELKEINLTPYFGDYHAFSFENVAYIETLHLRLNEEKLNQLYFLKPLTKLQTLYLYIDGKPQQLESFNAFADLKMPAIKEVHIIADMMPKDLDYLMTQINQINSLQTLGLSVDRITDLPKNISHSKFMSKLVLYDNLSVFATKGIDDLSEEKLNIVFSLADDLVSGIAISYFSNKDALSEFETNYLKSLFKGEIFGPNFMVEEQSSEDNNYTSFKAEFKPDFKRGPEFLPPYEPIVPKDEIFVINPQKNSILYSATGLKIMIPANAFENENKEVIKESIYIKITQLTQAIELLFAGINLKNYQNYLMNKLMFNIAATTEKNNAQLIEGFQIKINLPTAIDSAQPYFFDYESLTWQNNVLYQQVFANTFVSIDFYKIENQGDFNAYYLLDTSSFDKRFKNGQHYFLNDSKNDNQLIYKQSKFYTDLDRTWTKDYNKSGKLLGYRVKRGKAFIKIQKVIPKNRAIDRLYFKVIDKTKQGIVSELSHFKNINFNYKTDPSDKRYFHNEYVANIKYYDVRIEYSLGKEFCTIILKTPFGFKELKALITDTDDLKKKKKQMSIFWKSYQKYIKTLEKRQSDFESNNLQRLNDYNVFVKEKIKSLEKSNQFYEYKIHQLGSFGLFYNRQPEFNTHLIAQYTDENGLPIDVKSLYLIDKRYNTVFKINPGNLSFNPNECMYMIACDFNGNLYYATKNDLNTSSLVNNSLTYIKLKKLKSSITSIDFFNQLIRN
jgi:hypothetical protein